MRRIVVAGAGLAGHRSVLALRDAGFDGELTVIGSEPDPPYDRPPLSKQLLRGEFTPEQCYFPAARDAATWLLGQTAAGLDTGRRTVTLADGTRVPFDGLVIATGRSARRPSWLAGRAGGPLGGVHTLRTLRDALRFQSSLTSGSRVVIIGAGFIGCEVAATLATLGVGDVTLTDVAPRPMPVLGPEAGDRAAKLHADHGVKLRMGTSVAALEGGDRVRAVVLDDGERLPADLVLVAVGSAPNSGWLADSGLRLSAGAVVCDRYCFAADGVVTAGDIAAWPHPHGDPACVEHWTNARDMAAVAAGNLIADSGDRAPLRSVPTFWSDQYNVKIKSAGLLRAANRYRVVDEDPARPSLVIEAYRDEDLVGAIVFNRNRTILDYQRRLAEVSHGTASHGTASRAAVSGRSELCRRRRTIHLPAPPPGQIAGASRSATRPTARSPDTCRT
jgi:NADPH-dependent 2,4-dienoyl-CoA reductase/sulfur reductase-like enzyme